MRRIPLSLSVAAVAALIAAGALVPEPAPAHASPGPIDLVTPLQGFLQFWTPSSTPGSLDGTVVNSDIARAVLSRNDQIVTWINDNATSSPDGGQQFDALQASLYGSSPSSYDQSIVIGVALGSVLGPIYIAGRQSGALPLTSALIDSETGSAGAVAGGAVGIAKDTYLYPRPFLPSTTAAGPDACPVSPAMYNGASLHDLRVGQPWADADGDLLIDRVAATVDGTGEFTPSGTPTLDPGYDGLCTAGGYPSGHTTTAYQAGITLATLLPELAPEILSRASEQGDDRLVLGVHSPLDIMSGRIGGHVAIASVWSDPQFVQSTLQPAMAELRSYLEAQCGGAISACYASGAPYSANPYGGAAMPYGTAQIVTDRSSAIAAYEERMTYRFPISGTQGLPPEVPAGAENLLLSTFPTLTDAQRVAVIAQTEIGSGYPLDLSGTGSPAWERIDLAAAMSATVQLAVDGSAAVVSTGGTATVLPAVTPAPVLPVTGADVEPSTVAVGAGAVALGVLLLVGVRRRAPRGASRRS